MYRKQYIFADNKGNKDDLLRNMAKNVNISIKYELYPAECDNFLIMGDLG